MTDKGKLLYLLNAPLLTDYGDYSFEGPLSVGQARDLLQWGFVSAIGHQGTAEFLSSLFNKPIERNRQPVSLDVGDRALVLRLETRLDENVVLDAEQIAEQLYQLGLITRTG